MLAQLSPTPRKLPDNQCLTKPATRTLLEEYIQEDTASMTPPHNDINDYNFKDIANEVQSRLNNMTTSLPKLNLKGLNERTKYKPTIEIPSPQSDPDKKPNKKRKSEEYNPEN